MMFQSVVFRKHHLTSISCRGCSNSPLPTPKGPVKFNRKSCNCANVPIRSSAVDHLRIPLSLSLLSLSPSLSLQNPLHSPPQSLLISNFPFTFFSSRFSETDTSLPLETLLPNHHRPDSAAQFWLGHNFQGRKSSAPPGCFPSS